jgi:RimJ/RimL family protein N-acetyltransferase
MTQPILSIDCNEPEGIVTRHIYPMPLSPENLSKLWSKSKRLKNIFGHETEGDWTNFLSVLMTGGNINDVAATGLFWVVDDFVGVFYMTRIIPGVDALVHYIFFDKRHRGREALVKGMIKWGIERYRFNRISVELPEYASAYAKSYIENHLGFKREGKKRKAAQYKGMWFDITLYGLLRSEALSTEENEKWEQDTGNLAVAQQSE